MIVARRISSLLACAFAAACSSGINSPGFGIEQRVEVAPLPLPTGLPAPIPVQLTDAFPSLLFDHPVFLTSPPDGSDRVVVVEQRGRVLIFANDEMTTSTTTFLDIESQVQFGGEEGLLGFVFHPDYASNGWFYVYYTRGGPRRSVLSRFTISGDPNVADPTSELVLLEVAQPFSNHNSGSLAFGPDGKLYVACGDGGSANDPGNNGQNLATLLGNVLRLEDDGSVPADNPFVGGSNGERPEIWAYGLRNPWRMSFDRATGELWVGDVGQGQREEINVLERGGNYGWPVFEGNRSNRNPQNLPASTFRAPVYDYDHSLGASITGGYVYRGSAVPALVGAYVYADFVSGRVWAAVWDGTQVVENLQIASASGPASFGEDEQGELYVCCFDGRVRRFTPDASNTAVTVMPPTLSATGLFADVATLTPAPGLLEYDVNVPLWSDGAEKRRWIALPGNSRIIFDPTEAWTFAVGTAMVKHFEIDTLTGVQRLETRVLLRQTGGWVGYSYRWNSGGTDADLVVDGGDSFVLDVSDGAGGTTTQTWNIPSRAQCVGCHPAAAGGVLGVRTRQLNRQFDYRLRSDNQLRTWNHIGLFTTSIGNQSQYGAFGDAFDSAAAVAPRARSYLDVNCANCHRPGGPTSVNIDLRYDTAVASMQLFGVSATSPVPSGIGMRAVLGSAAQSDLWLRMRLRDAYGMPVVGSNLVHEEGSSLIAAWISSLSVAASQLQQH